MSTVYKWYSKLYHFLNAAFHYAKNGKLAPARGANGFNKWYNEVVSP